MVTRVAANQSEHDQAVLAAAQIYTNKGKTAWTNPGSEKNRAWNGRYIDVIAVESANADQAWVVEIETTDSVSDSEATSQWIDYDSAYSVWYLAVPSASESGAQRLLGKHKIAKCTIITWRRNKNGTHTYWGLPGI